MGMEAVFSPSNLRLSSLFSFFFLTWSNEISLLYVRKPNMGDEHGRLGKKTEKEGTQGE